MPDFYVFSTPESVLFGPIITVRDASDYEEYSPWERSLADFLPVRPISAASVAALQQLHRAPPGHELLVRLGGRLGVAARQRRQARRPPVRVSRPRARSSSGEQVDQAAVVQLDDRARMELLQPPGALLDRLGDRRVAQRLAQHRQRPVRPPAGLGDLGAVAQRPPARLAATRSRSSRSTKTNQRSGTPHVAICSCTRGTPCSSTRAPLRQSSTIALAWPASTGGTNASASTDGTPSRALERRLGDPQPQVPRADQQASRPTPGRTPRPAGPAAGSSPRRAPPAQRCAAAGPSTGATARPSVAYRRQNTCRSRSKAVNGS